MTDTTTTMAMATASATRAASAQSDGECEDLFEDFRSRLAAVKVLVVGDAMLDRYWHGAVERISPEAPVPVVRVTKTEERVGAAANVAVNILALGAQCSFLSVVGADADGIRLHDLLKKAGIAACLTQDSSLQTTVKLRVIGRSQQLLRIDFENFPQRDVLAAQTQTFVKMVGSHDVVLFSDYQKGTLTHVSEMISLARKAGKTVLIDPKGKDWSMYRGANVITPNRAELQQVVGTWSDDDDLTRRVTELRQKLELECLLFTRSEEGMSLFDTQGRMDVGASAREVFDVTGAGDTVIAVMAALVATGMGFREAMRYANKAGGLVVGRFGTATVSADELWAIN